MNNHAENGYKDTAKLANECDTQYSTLKNLRESAERTELYRRAQTDEKMRIVTERLKAAMPVDLKKALTESGFSSLQSFTHYGNALLKDKLDQAERNLNNSDAFGKATAQARVDSIRDEIGIVLRAIAQKTFFGEYTYWTSNVEVYGNESSFQMEIDTQFLDRNPQATPKFPVPGVIVDGGESRWNRITLNVHGRTASIQELVRNKNNYRAIIIFNNLQYNSGSKADVLAIDIVKVQ